MELRQLAAFVATAEASSFSGAARALGVGQPAVSQAVRRLEADLGLVLLERSSRRVALTAAGEALLADARAVVAADARLRATAAQLAEGAAGVVRLATTSGAAALVHALSVGLRGRRPGAELRLHRARGVPKVDALLAGELDAALVRARADRAGVEHVEVARAAWDVLLARDHPLARGEGPLDLAALLGSPFVPIARGTPVALHDELAAAARRRGSALRSTPAAGSLDEVLAVLATSSAWSLTTSGGQEGLGAAGVVARPLDPAALAPARIWLALRAHDRSPLVAALRDVAAALG